MFSLKVAETLALTATPLPVGDSLVTVGGVVSPPPPLPVT